MGSNASGQYDFPIASRGHRLAGFALDLLLMSVTCYLGWIIWAAIVWGQGQTPAKQILKMRVYGSRTKRPATWGHMAIRDLLIPMAYGIPGFILAFLLTYLFSGPYFFNSLFNSYDYGYASPISTLTFYFFVSAPGLIDTLMIFNGPTNMRFRDRWAKTVVLNVANNNRGPAIYGQPQAYGAPASPYAPSAPQSSPVASNDAWTGNEGEKPWWFNNPDVQAAPSQNPAPTGQANQKFCSSCGNPSSATSKFCTGCGKSL